jgi:hypothetical protein
MRIDTAATKLQTLVALAGSELASLREEPLVDDKRAIIAELHDYFEAGHARHDLIAGFADAFRATLELAVGGNADSDVSRARAVELRQACRAGVTVLMESIEHAGGLLTRFHQQPAGHPVVDKRRRRELTPCEDRLKAEIDVVIGIDRSVPAMFATFETLAQKAAVKANKPPPTE